MPGAAAFLRGMNPLRRSRARFPLLSPAVTSSPGAGEVFPLRESQAVRFIAKVLGIPRKLPAVLLAFPLGKLSPQVTERARTLPLGKVAVNTVSRRKEYPRQRPQLAVYRLIYQFAAFCGRD